MSGMNTQNARPDPPMTNLVQPNPAGNGRPSVNPRHFSLNRVHPPGAAGTAGTAGPVHMIPHGSPHTWSPLRCRRRPQHMMGQITVVPQTPQKDGKTEMEKKCGAAGTAGCSTHVPHPKPSSQNPFSKSQLSSTTDEKRLPILNCGILNSNFWHPEVQRQQSKIQMRTWGSRDRLRLVKKTASPPDFLRSDGSSDGPQQTNGQNVLNGEDTSITF
eukprot:gene23823-biopygen10392